jgi:hypothetical protein
VFLVDVSNQKVFTQIDVIDSFFRWINDLMAEDLAVIFAFDFQFWQCSPPLRRACAAKRAIFGIVLIS